MAKIKRIDFLVTGRGHFPFDMLRFDACFPGQSHDAVRLEENDLRTIRLRQYSEDPHITVPRWSSFGWEVEHDGSCTDLYVDPDNCVRCKYGRG